MHGRLLSRDWDSLDGVHGQFEARVLNRGRGKVIEEREVDRQVWEIVIG